MKRLNQKEEEVMRILWRLKKAFVKEILAEIAPPKPPITTLSSLVRKLEQEGFLSHESFGKSHRYFPIVEMAEYRKKNFKAFVNQFFGGSTKQVLSYFVEEEQMDPKELNQLLEEIRKQDQA
ncbi:MAG: BlaI/MecI/CopY family transcriptional regulator [Bacteroidota bacterium]